MERLTRNLTALASGFAIGGLLVISADANAAKFNAPIKGNVNSVRDGFFKPSTGNPTTSYTVGPTTVRDVTATGTDVTVSRETPFGFKSKFGPELTGAVIDAIKMPKPTLGTFAKGLFRGGLWGLGLGLAVEGLVELGYQWKDHIDNFGNIDRTIPPGTDLSGYASWMMQSTDNYRVANSLSAPNVNKQTFVAQCPKQMFLPAYGLSFYLSSSEFPALQSNRNFVCSYNNGTKTIGWAIDSAKPIYSDFPFVPFTDAQWLEATTKLADQNPKKLIDAIAASGQPVEYDVLDTRTLKSPMVSPSVQQSKTVTSEPDGSTKTAITSGQTSLTMTPQGQIDVEDKLTTTTTSTYPDGSSSTSTSETTTRPPVETEYPTVPEAQPELPADPAMPTVPELYKQKYKDGLNGVWDAKKQGFMNTEFIQSIKSLAPEGLDSGSCPQWSLGFDMGVANYGEQSLPFPCWLAPFLKAVMMLTAAFTARKIIWG